MRLTQHWIFPPPKDFLKRDFCFPTNIYIVSLTTLYISVRVACCDRDDQMKTVTIADGFTIIGRFVLRMRSNGRRAHDGDGEMYVFTVRRWLLELRTRRRRRLSQSTVLQIHVFLNDYNVRTVVWVRFALSVSLRCMYRVAHKCRKLLRSGKRDKTWAAENNIFSCVCV